MMKNIFILPLIAIVAGVVIGSLATNFSLLSSSTTAGSSGSIEYTGVVCIGINEPAEQGTCRHNVFTETGQNATRQALANGLAISNPITQAISLLNCTGVGVSAPNSTQIQTCGNYTTEHNSCGLNRVNGTIRNITAGCTGVATCPGNWSITNEFTATASCTDITINATGLHDSDTDRENDTFAANTFAAATLQGSDKINVTWFVWVV